MRKFRNAKNYTSVTLTRNFISIVSTNVCMYAFAFRLYFLVFAVALCGLYFRFYFRFYFLLLLSLLLSLVEPAGDDWANLPSR